MLPEAKLDLRALVRDVPDFPKAGIVFKDITPLLGSALAYERAVELLALPFRDQQISKVAAIESRGFIFGASVATVLGCGFVPIRKPGKLPWSTHRHEYTLEYGSGSLEIHDDAFTASDRVLIVDDVLATGGTAAAAAALVSLFDATVVSCAVLIELGFLSGRLALGPTPVHAVLVYH